MWFWVLESWTAGQLMEGQTRAEASRGFCSCARTRMCMYFEARSQLITRRRVTMQRRSKLAQENEMRILTYGGGGVTSLRMYLYTVEAVRRCVESWIG